ncbi:hypothetical protein BC349_08120 [Flavihumibacter stibioxidans]|uniref:Secreted protein n=1 Tax=Flavihumibacter stibioxidans TaxID=1834163 RepID=A0ABR7M7K9_9BACT|nr:hypothetical protein [Flavihumibacter stibioxidans]
MLFVYRQVIFLSLALCSDSGSNLNMMSSSFFRDRFTMPSFSFPRKARSSVFLGSSYSPPQFKSEFAVLRITDNG